MAVLTLRGPVLALPAGTDAAEAERLSGLLDRHGVSGLLGVLDAVAALALVSAPVSVAVIGDAVPSSKTAPERKRGQ